MATDPTRRSGDDDIPPPKYGDGDKAAGAGAEEEAYAALPVAIEKLKEKQHDLNARQVYEELQKQDPAKWANLTIAGVKKMCSKMAKASRADAHEAAAAIAQSEAAAAAANTQVCTLYVVHSTLWQP